MAAMERGEPREEWMKAQAPPPTDQSTFHLMKIFKWFQPTARAFKVRFLHKCFMPLQCHLMLLKCCHPLALLLSATPKRRVIPRMTSKWQHWGEQRAVDSMKKQRGKGEKKGRGVEVENTEAWDELRDEKGKILFSFHVIKYLLWLHKSPTDRHSGLKERFRDGWAACQDCDTIPLALSVFIGGGARGVRYAALH